MEAVRVAAQGCGVTHGYVQGDAALLPLGGSDLLFVDSW